MLRRTKIGQGLGEREEAVRVEVGRLGLELETLDGMFSRRPVWPGSGPQQSFRGRAN